MRARRWEQIEAQHGQPIKQLLEQLYNDDRMGIKQIGRHLGVSDRVIWGWFDALNIPRRARSEAVANQWRDNDARRRKQQQDIKGAIQAGQIDNRGDNNPAKKPEARQKISLAKMGAGNAMYGMFGASNPGWKGGKVTFRGQGWDSIRAQAKRRDHNRCRRCGSAEQLQVHHIRPYRESQDNDLSNLVTLCAKCHMLVEYHGATWH